MIFFRFNLTKFLFLSFMFRSIVVCSMDENQQARQVFEENRNAALRVVMQEGYLEPEDLGPRFCRDFVRLFSRNHDAPYQELASAKFDRHHSIVFSPCGRLCAYSNVTNDICIHEAQTGRQMHLMRGQTENAQCLAFSPDGKSLFSTNWNNDIREWDVATGKILRHISFTRPGVHFFQEFSPDCQSIVFRGDLEGGCEGIWNFNTGEVVDCHAGDGVNATFCPNGNLLLFKQDDKVCVWDVAAKRIIKTFNAYGSKFVFNKDGSLMASDNHVGYVHIFDTKKWNIIRSFKLDPQYLNVTFSPDNRFVAIGGAKGINFFDIQKGGLDSRLPHEEGMMPMESSCRRDRNGQDHHAALFGNIAVLAFNSYGQLGTKTYAGVVRIWNTIPENIRVHLRFLTFNQLLVFMQLIRPLALGRVIHLTPGSAAWNMVNQMPDEIKMLVAACLTPAPVTEPVSMTIASSCQIC